MVFRRLLVAAALCSAGAVESQDLLPHHLHLGRAHVSKKQSPPPKALQKTSLLGLKVAQPVETPLPVSVMRPEAPVEEPVAAVSAEETKNPTADHLTEELTEMKQRRSHIKQLESALKADASLLRESTILEKVSKSRRGHEVAERQMKQAARLVKDTEAMLRESRAEAVESSKEMMHEAAAVRAAADSLGNEAKEQLKIFAKGAEASEAKAEPAPTAAPVATEAPSKSAQSDDLDLGDIEDEN